MKNEKLNSRKFWFVAFWNFMFLVSIVGVFFSVSSELALAILPWVGGMTTTYIGIQGLIDGLKK